MCGFCGTLEFWARCRCVGFGVFAVNSGVLILTGSVKTEGSGW